MRRYVLDLLLRGDWNSARSTEESSRAQPYRHATHNGHAAHAAAAQAVDQAPDGLHAEQQAHGPLCEPHQHVLNESSWLGRAGGQSSDSESVGICVYAHE